MYVCTIEVFFLYKQYLQNLNKKVTMENEGTNSTAEMTERQIKLNVLTYVST